MKKSKTPKRKVKRRSTKSRTKVAAPSRPSHFSIDHTREQASRAIIDHLIRRTVGVINEVRVVGTHIVTGKPGDGEVPGTGCLIGWNTKRLVLTAKHVIDTVSNPTQIRIASFADTPMDFQPSDRVTMDHVYAGTALGAESEIHYCEWEDLAAITLPDSFRVGELANIGDEWADPPEGSMVGCIGFPIDHNVTVDHRRVGDKDEVGLGLLPVFLDTDVLPQPSADDRKFKITDHDEERHYLVAYTSNLSRQAHGMSGAAIWMPNIKGIVWTPNFRFAGTCINTFNKGYKAHQGPVVQVVKASIVRRFLEEKFGGAGRSRTDE
jgi:hypothetical protein